MVEKQHFIIIGIFILYSQAKLMACSCGYSPDNFMQNLSYPFVGLVEIIDTDTSYLDSTGYTMQRVRVLEEYTSNSKKELMILDSRGFECFSSLPSRIKGEKFLIKGNFESDAQGNAYLGLKKVFDKSRTITTLSNCDYTVLPVKNTTVRGDITKSKYWTKKRMKIIKKRNSGEILTQEEEANLYKSRTVSDYQEMSLKKLRRKLKRKIKNRL